MHTNHQDLIQEQFTKQSETFGKIAGHHNGLEMIVSMCNAQSHDTVLDVACGPGIVGCAFAPKVKSVVGIDVVPSMIHKAMARQQSHGYQNMRWDMGDVNPLPYANESFSMAVTRYSFHHLLYPAMVLKEMMRVTKPGGKVALIDVYVTDHQQARFYDKMEKLRDPSHVRALLLSELGGLMRKSNLIDIQTDFYRLDVDLEEQLRASFPNPGDDEKIRRMVRDDIGRNQIGIQAYLKDGRMHFSYPIVAMVGTKI